MLSKENVQDIYGLTPMQEGMLLQFARDPASSAYIEQFDFVLEGEVDGVALQRSLDALIAKYDVLRTIFSFRKTDAPRQIVLKTRSGTIVHEDYAAQGQAGALQAVDAFKQADRSRGFDLSSDLLIRVALLTLAPRQHRMVVSFHHIILDGWCLGTLFGDFFGYYERLRNNPQGEIREREAVPYREYIRWVGKQERKVAEQFWVEYLKGYQAETGPAYFDLKPPAGSEHAVHLFSLGTALSTRLAALAKARHVTINSLFQAAWGVLLQKFNNTDDVVFGSVVSGRPPELPGVEGMVGLFINTQPMRVACPPETAFIELARQVQLAATQAMAHDYFPLFVIQSATAMKNRLLNHIVAFENYPISQRMKEISANSQGLRILDVQVFEQTNYDFNVIVCPGDDIRVNFTYNRLRYGDDVVAGMARSLLCLLNHAAEQPDASVASLPLCASEDRHTILQQFNATARPYPKQDSIVTQFLQQVQTHGEAVALRWPGHSLSYRQSHGLALQLGARMRERGVQRGGAVALLTPRGPDLLIGILATLYCGAAYVPVDPATPVDRVRFILDDVGANLLCSVESFARLVPPGIDALMLDGVASAAGNATNTAIGNLAGNMAENTSDMGRVNLLPDTASTGTINTASGSAFQPEIVAASEIAYVMYTSGSTGLPKGCAVTHQNVTRLVRNSNFVDFDARLCFLQLGSPAFDASTFEIWGGLLNGGVVALVDEATILDAKRLRTALVDLQVQAIFMTGALFNQHCETDPTLFGALRYLMVGGEVLSPKYIERARQANPGLIILNGYGPTENTTFSATCDIRQAYVDAIPIGKPIANSTAYILDPHGNLLPPGAYGELCVGGDGVAQGYVKRPELTAERFIADPFAAGRKLSGQLDSQPDGQLSGQLSGQLQRQADGPFVSGGRLYRTGDIARWLPDGQIGLLGRNDFQVKIRGFRIELGEIERTLCSSADIKEAVVLAQDGPGGKQLHAFYVSEQELAVQSLRAALAARLPSYMVPLFYLRVERMPLTINGKVDRAALLALDKASERPALSIVAPRSQTEHKIAQICRDVLGIEQIGVDDNFFDIGANSLNLITINNRLKDAFARDIALTVLFEYTSVARLAEFLGADQTQEGAKLAQEKQQLVQAKNTLLKNRNLMRSMEEDDE